MPGNSFGQHFRITTFGESHGPLLGVVIDGCPAGFPLDVSKVQAQLDLRKPGQSKITTSRKETDQVEFVSGLFEGLTTGTPLAALIRNQDQRTKDYSHIAESFRPSHADYTYSAKYGHRDYRGGGRASARETATRVIAGAVAQQLLETQGISIVAYVSAVGELELSSSYAVLNLSQRDSNLVRCPDIQLAGQMEKLIEKTKANGDSLGGKINCVIRGLPPGLGEPVFDRLEADLAKAMLSIQTTKAFEIGSGFAGTELRGSQHNDEFTSEEGRITTKTNHSGGVQGGISNGMDVYFRVGFKPVATIMKKQKSVDQAGRPIEVEGRGRHDPCVVPRAVPIVEAMASLVTIDHFLRNQNSRWIP